MANRKWFRGRYLAARGVGVGREILSVMRDERRRGSTSTSAGDDVLGWWLEDGTAEYFLAVVGLLGIASNSPSIEQAPGPSEASATTLGPTRTSTRRWPSNTRFSTTRI